MFPSTAEASAVAPGNDQCREALTREALHARIELLRSQLNPDFLFNTLNSLSGLVLAGRNSDADRLIANLARYLRAPSALEEPALISVEKEVGIAAALLEIEAVRMDRPRSVTVSVDPELAGKEIPCLILLPLMEAVVREGRLSAPARWEITLGARLEKGEVLLDLDQRFDKSIVMDQSRFLAAIEPLCARLAMIYGSRNRLDVAIDTGRISTRLRLPAE